MLKLIISAFVVWATLFAQPQHVAAQNKPYTASNVEAFDETGVPLTIDDVTSGSASHQFRQIRELPTTKRYVARWYRFLAPPMDGTPLILLLSPSVGEADLYFPRNDRTFGIVRFGMRVPFNQRSYPVALPVTQITPQMRNGARLYLRTYGSPVELTIQPERAYARFRSHISLGTLFFAGFIASIGVLSLFLSFYFREPMFRLQSALMATAILYVLTENELSWEYLWPSASVDLDFADAVVFLAYLLALIMFGRRFLSLDKEMPAFDRALWVAFALNCLFTLLQPLQPDSALVIAVAPLVNVAPFLLLLLAGMLRFRAGFRQARFFVSGFGGMLLIFITIGLIFRFTQFPVSTQDVIFAWGFDLGVAFDSLFFQFALADRVISANSERDEAQRKALVAQEKALDTQRSAIETLERHNAAFGRFVPREFLDQLGRTDIVEVGLGDHVEREMGVLFSDIRSFTALSELMTPRESFDFVNSFFAQIGPVIREHGGFIDKYIGDAVMALFARKATDAVDAAIALQREVRRFNEDRARTLREPVAVGVGVHWGKLILGTIGEERRLETTVVSDAVNVASRLQGVTKALGARIVVSDALVSALGDRGKYCLRPMGTVDVPGYSHAIRILEVCDADEPDDILLKMGALEPFEAALHAYAAGDFALSVRLFESIVARNPHDSPAVYYRERSAFKQTLPEKLAEGLDRFKTE